MQSPRIVTLYHLFVTEVPLDCELMAGVSDENTVTVKMNLHEDEAHTTIYQLNPITGEETLAEFKRRQGVT